VFHLDEKYSGQSHLDKFAKIREELEKKKQKAIVVTMLDEVAWLFNLRGSDIDFNPGPWCDTYLKLRCLPFSYSILFIRGDHARQGCAVRQRQTTGRIGEEVSGTECGASSI